MTTGEDFEEFMSISEKQTYLKTRKLQSHNYHQIQLILLVIMSWVLDLKLMGGFNERMSQIASDHPNSPMADRYKTGESHKKLED